MRRAGGLAVVAHPADKQKSRRLHALPICNFEAKSSLCRRCEGPPASAEGPSGLQLLRCYAVTVRVGLEPHSP
jgi:hypothetical protein